MIKVGAKVISSLDTLFEKDGTIGKIIAVETGGPYLSTIITVKWDGIRRPCIYCPAHFGSREELKISIL